MEEGVALIQHLGEYGELASEHAFRDDETLKERKVIPGNEIHVGKDHRGNLP